MNYYYTKDHLGSIRELTDSSGAIHARYDYDPYGRRTKLTGDLDADFGFTGHYVSSQYSDLAFAPFRIYSCDLGRWISRDPIGELGGINLYAYVGNGPIRLIDLFGLLTMTYSVSSGTLYVSDLWQMDFRTFSGFHSGNGIYLDDPGSENVSGHGPIPLADYMIFNRDGLYKNTGFPAYILDPIDELPGNDTLERNGRFAFRLHFGRQSDGCIVTPNKDDLDELNSMLEHSHPIPSNGPDAIPHPWYGTHGLNYGGLHVIW